MGSLRIIPFTLKQANKLVGEWHRHHDLEIGHRWSIGVLQNGEVVGAAIVGRPKARMTPQYSTAEVTRLVTNGAQNACSMLYAHCARAAGAMGFEEIQTFILKSESGVTLRAAGWQEDTDYDRPGTPWNCASRPRTRKEKTEEPKRRFFKRLVH